MKTQTLKVLTALERPDRNAAVVELVRQGITAENIIEALTDAARATFVIRGRVIPNNKIRLRALTIVLLILHPEL